MRYMCGRVNWVSESAWGCLGGSCWALVGPCWSACIALSLANVLKRSKLVWIHADTVRAHCSNPALPSTYKNAESLITSRWLKMVCDSLSFSHTYSGQKVAEEQPRWWPYLLKSVQCFCSQIRLPERAVCLLRSALLSPPRMDPGPFFPALLIDSNCEYWFSL